MYDVSENKKSTQYIYLKWVLFIVSIQANFQMNIQPDIQNILINGEVMYTYSD